MDLVVYIEEAARAGSIILSQVYGSPRRYAQRPSRQYMERYGPNAMAKKLIHVLQALTAEQKQTWTDPSSESLKALERFFAAFVQPVAQTESVKDEASGVPSAAPVIRDALVVHVRGLGALGWQILANVLQSNVAQRHADIEAWSETGFYEFYQALLPDRTATALRMQAAEIVALIFGFILNEIRVGNIHSLEGIDPGLHALQAGAIPIGYESSTKTLFVSPWSQP